MSRKYRDFSNTYDRVNAQEGEETVPATAFGAYGDEADFGDDADFGNVNMVGSRSGSEAEGVDTFSYGDFDDSMDSEAEPTSVKSMDSGPVFSNRGRRRKGTTGYDKAPFAYDDEGFALTALDQTKKNLGQMVKEFSEDNRAKIEEIQAKAMLTGQKIPSVIDLIPAKHREKMIAKAAEKGAGYAMATKVIPRDNIPLASVAAAEKVVTVAGNQLSQKDLAPAKAEKAAKAPKVLDMAPMVVQTKRGPVVIEKKKVIHPMMMLQMGAGGNAQAMGLELSLSQLWEEAKSSATSAIQTGLDQLKASATQSLANTATQFASNLIQKPATQAAVQQAATQAAVQSTVQTIMQPETQAKIKKYALYAGIGVGGIAALLVARKLMK